MSDKEETREIKMEDGSVQTMTLSQFADAVVKCQSVYACNTEQGTRAYLQENMTALRRRWEDGWTPLTVSTEIDVDGL